MPEPVPRNNGPISNRSKNSRRSSPSLATASGNVMPDVYFADSGLIQNVPVNGENGRFGNNIQKTLEIEQGFCTLTVPCRCWKSYLPYSKRSENIINRKIRQFYIEAIPQKKSQLRKKFIFFRVQKKIEKLSAKI